MNTPAKLDYQTVQPKPRVGLPPDWRRRLIIAAIAAPIIFLVTFQASWAVQSSAVTYMEGGFVNARVRSLQDRVDAFTRSTGHTPVNLAAVPDIQKLAAQDPSYLVDRWGTPFFLKTMNRINLVVSYGRDKLPGGSGLDADITVNRPYGSEMVTLDQFIHGTRLLPVIIVCVGNALLVAILAFVGKSDTRQNRGLANLLLELGIKAVIALVVATLIVSVHAPSGH